MTTPTPHSSPAGTARRLRASLLAVTVVLLSLLLAAAPAFAQSELRLEVIDAESGLPLANAEVVVSGALVGVSTGEGVVHLRVAPPRGTVIRIRRIGYGERAIPAPGPTSTALLLTVPLELDPVALSGVSASAGTTVRSPRLTGFYERVRSGAGLYITREEIERRRPRDLADLLRSVPGIRIIASPIGERARMETNRSLGRDIVNPDASPCAIQYFIDGSPIKPIHDGVLNAEILLNEIEGIEVYRRGATVASQYQRMNGSCGVIMIWKKERG